MIHSAKASAWNSRGTRSHRNANDCLGIFFGRTALEGCRAGRRLFGAVRYERCTVARDGRTLGEALGELLTKLDAKKKGLPVFAALPTEDCYFATRPTVDGASGASTRSLLRESLRSSAARLDAMAVDVIRWQPDRRSVAGIVAAPKDLVDEIRDVVARSGHALRRVTPAASCLIAAASDTNPPERDEELTTRVLLGDSSLLAVTSRGRRAVQWRRSPLPIGDEATGIVSAVRSLDASASSCGLDRRPKSVVLHGRRELRSLIDRQRLAEDLPEDFRWVDSPSLLPADVAQAMADQWLADDDEGFDLIRRHRDPIELRGVVPYREIGSAVAIAALSSGLLWLRWNDANDANATPASLVSNASPTVVGHASDESTRPSP